jgi:hypothetical protein
MMGRVLFVWLYKQNVITLDAIDGNRGGVKVFLTDLLEEPNFLFFIFY